MAYFVRPASIFLSRSRNSRRAPTGTDVAVRDAARAGDPRDAPPTAAAAEVEVARSSVPRLRWSDIEPPVHDATTSTSIARTSVNGSAGSRAVICVETSVSLKQRLGAAPEAIFKETESINAFVAELDSDDAA